MIVSIIWHFCLLANIHKRHNLPPVLFSVRVKKKSPAGLNFLLNRYSVKFENFEVFVAFLENLSYGFFVVANEILIEQG